LNFKNSCVVGGVIDRQLWYCEKVVTLLICRWFMLFVHKVHMKKGSYGIVKRQLQYCLYKKLSVKKHLFN